jgi:hypothetical protein
VTAATHTKLLVELNWDSRALYYQDLLESGTPVAIGTSRFALNVSHGVVQVKASTLRCQPYQFIDNNQSS